MEKSKPVLYNVEDFYLKQLSKDVKKLNFLHKLSVLIIGLNESGEISTNSIIHKIKSICADSNQEVDFYIGDRNSDVTHLARKFYTISIIETDNIPTELEISLANTDQQNAANKFRVIGIYGDYFSNESTYYWRKFDLIVSANTIHKLPKKEKLFRNVFPTSFEMDEDLVTTADNSNRYLKQILNNLVKSLNEKHGRLLLIFPVFDYATTEKTLVYNLINKSFESSTDLLEVPLQNATNISQPVMVFKAENLLSRVERCIESLHIENLTYDSKILQFGCPCYKKYIKSLQSFADKQKYSNKLIDMYFRPTQEDILRCPNLSEATKKCLIVETRSKLRQLLMDTLCNDGDFKLRFQKEYFLLRMKKISQEKETTLD